jgi:hypothetical protein
MSVRDGDRDREVDQQIFRLHSRKINSRRFSPELDDETHSLQLGPVQGLGSEFRAGLPKFYLWLEHS